MEITTPIPLPTKPVVSDIYRSPVHLASLRDNFKRNGFVKLPGLLNHETFNIVEQNLNSLHAKRIRRDFVMPGFGTERKMSVVGGSTLASLCTPLVALYGNIDLRAVISGIIGNPVNTVPHYQEFMVVNFLDGEADTHGWHTDDPQYALIIITECPEPGCGGGLEYVLDWRNVCAQYHLDPDKNVEKSIETLRAAGLVLSQSLQVGDCYLLNAGAAMHRVMPVIGHGRRKALNMAFDTRIYRKFGDTALQLYGT